MSGLALGGPTAATAPASEKGAQHGGRSWIRWAIWVVTVVAAAVAIVVGSQRPSHATLASETNHIASEVRCPVCEAQTAAQSDAPAALQIRDEIQSELEAGESSRQILNGLVAAYGSGILERPKASGVGLLVWLLPLVAVAAAAGGLALAFARWRRREGPAAQIPSLRGVLRDRLTKIKGGHPASLPKRWWAVVGLGVLLIGGGISWAAVAMSSQRSPGGEITGQSLGPSTLSSTEESQLLQAAQTASSKGDALDAVKDYQKVLSSDPTQPEALTGEGWLLAQTSDAAVVQQGIQMLASAETADPTYPPAHLYRGLVLLGEGDYASAVPELQWYLSHGPSSQLVGEVRKALAEAKSGAAAGTKG